MPRAKSSAHSVHRAVLRLAVPIVAVQVGMMTMGVVDTVMVGHVSAGALAAVALGNLYYFSVSIFGIGILMALDPVIAQSVGAGDDRAIARGVQRGLLIALGLSVFSSLLLLPGKPVFTLLRQPADVVPTAAAYAQVLIPGMLPFFVYVVLRQSLQAMKHVTPLVLTIIAANLANVALNWVFIYGHLGMPALGAVGSGWATSLSRWLMALSVLALTWRYLRRFLLPIHREVFALRPMAALVRLGIPIGIQHELEFSAFGAIALLMGWLGTVEMAAHQVAISLAALTFMVPLGIGAAAAVLVGQAVGEDDPERARQAAWVTILYATLFMASSAIVMLTLPGPIANLFTEETEVIVVAALLIPIAGVFQVFDGIQVVATGVLRGVGDTRSPMIVSLVGFWLIGLPISIYLGFRTPAGPRGLWWGLVAGLAVVAIFLLIRIRIGLTRQLRRLHIDDDHLGDPQEIVA
jgi:MATE family multidrug resistance protein